MMGLQMLRNSLGGLRQGAYAAERTHMCLLARIGLKPARRRASQTPD